MSSYIGDNPFLFFSYCHADREEVFRIADAVDKAGYRVWYDKAISGAELDGAPEGWFGAVSYTDGGGVASMEIGGKTYSGTELRSLLGLNSTCFTVSRAGDTVTFSVRGYGHRVGMSQYGANYMAAQGFDYRTILQYYYRGAEIKKLSQTMSETAG